MSAAPTAAAGASSGVSVRYLGEGRGFGMVVTRPVKEGEVLFTERPAALFQPNRPLVQTCSNARCMRVLGPLDAQVERAHSFYAQASGGSVKSALAPGPASDPEARKQRTELLQRLLPLLPLPAHQVMCRGCGSDNGACRHVYCSNECEESGWHSGGHALLCAGLHAPVFHFFSEVNVARNADLQVAAQILASFVAAVIARRSADPALDAPAVRALWQQHTSYHAAPWSAVLAVQTVAQQQQQQGGELPLRVVEEHVRRLQEQDERDATEAAAAAGDGSVAPVTTVGMTAPVAEPASAAAPAPSSSSWSSAEQSALTALAAAQKQYRAALARPHDILRDALLSSPAPGAAESRPLWAPYASLVAFDLLAGANRLNCTQSQTALPVPEVLPPPRDGAGSDASGQAELAARMALLMADPADGEASAAAAPASNASSVSSSAPVAVLLRSLEDLFAPMALPLANARALLPLHSKMNHSCAPTARVENWAERSTVAASAASVHRAQRRAEEAAERRRQISEAARLNANGSATNANNKKKKQKARKAAAAGEAVAAQNALRQWNEEGAALASIATQLEAGSHSAAAAPVSAAASPSSSCASASASASAAVSASDVEPVDAVRASTCEIVVRATRALQPGEEVLINYLPPGATDAPVRVRQQYLQTHYLFRCACARCEPTSKSS